MEWTQQEMNELYAKMQKKSTTDEEFRKKLLADPNKALEELSGKPLPEGCKIKVIENDPDYTATFVLPDLLSEELSDNDLESAAGGISFLLIVSVCGGAIGL